MKVFIYCLRDYDEKAFFDELAEKYGFEYDGCPGYQTVENIREFTKGFDAVSILASEFTDDMIRALAENGVRYITTRSIGTDHINLKLCKELGIRVGRSQYSPNSVANYTIMLMLMLCRNFKYIQGCVGVQDFTMKNKIGREFSECTVGVIGTGRIGKTVIDHIKGFGCKILAYDIYKNPEIEKEFGYVTFEELIKNSDIITFHAPSTPENYHMINDESIAMMKDGAMVVNCARGAMVDSDALIRGLASGKLGGAALDVLEDEHGLFYNNRMGDVLPNTTMNIFRSLPNVIVSPHTAFYTDSAVKEMCECVFSAIQAFETGKDTPIEAKFMG